MIAYMTTLLGTKEEHRGTSKGNMGGVMLQTKLFSYQTCRTEYQKSALMTSRGLSAIAAWPRVYDAQHCRREQIIQSHCVSLVCWCCSPCRNGHLEYHVFVSARIALKLRQSIHGISWTTAAKLERSLCGRLPVRNSRCSRVLIPPTI